MGGHPELGDEIDLRPPDRGDALLRNGAEPYPATRRAIYQ
jgi:hypothetical protein